MENGEWSRKATPKFYILNSQFSIETMWKQPTLEDLTAKLSVKEGTAFSASADYQGEPVRHILDMTADVFRDALRTNGRVRLSPVEHSIPGGCLSYAMDYALYDVLTRLDKPVNEDRRRKREAAERYLEKVAKGELTPESYGEEDTEVTGGPAAQLAHVAPNRVTPYGLNGY